MKLTDVEIISMSIECAKHILGKIQISNPCGINTLVDECVIQAYDKKHNNDFAKLSDWYKTIIIENALKVLLKEQKVTTTIYCDDEKGFECVFDLPIE